MANFSQSYSIVKNEPFKQYCCSFYGSQLWSFEKISVAWRKAFSVLWNVPRETHCRIIALLSESAPLSIQLKARFLTFVCKAQVHDNSTLKYVIKLACRNPMSVSARNWRDCINFAQDISMISKNVKQVSGEWHDTVSDIEIDSVCILREMIEVRKGMTKCDIFNIDDVEFIINDLCVN